tara:strand:- start:4853 stop:5542 length:690 start_codon:yes stop_codon:yes gene_type:complete
MATDFRQLRGSDLDVAEAAMVSIYCRIGDTNRATVSSGVVIKGPTDNRRGEVIVTTGHGVGNYDPTDLRQDCWVALDGGTRYRIHRIANSTDMAGASQDWAVVTTSAPFAEAVVRLPAVTLESIDYGVLPVAMFGRHFSNFDCRLNLNSRIVSDGQRVFLHDCGSERGQSGAPLVARVDGEISVIALNLGRVTNSQDPDAELLALALGLDGGFLAVLDGALRDVSLPAQ